MIDDIFLHRMIEMVYASYDEWYNPEEVYHKHRPAAVTSLNEMKEVHIKELLNHYDKERFEKCDNLYEERVKFLKEVQQIVDIVKGDWL